MVIRTSRLVLREFVEDDWLAVLAYQSDPRYLRYYEWTERTPEDVRRFVQSFVEQQRQRPRTKFQLAIVLRAEQRLIGNCGLRLKHVEALEGDIGYELAPQYWGQGYATEAAATMLEFGFSELRLHRITARCIAENTASARVLEKIGMKREGRLRENEWMKGRWWDTFLYAILEREFNERKHEGSRS